MHTHSRFCYFRFSLHDEDISEHGTRSCFRNELYNWKELPTSSGHFESDEFRLPSSGRSHSAPATQEW